ncbi:MAG: hypothetical protein KatS3mg108_1695 [Isosphaeraceae bacterium]|jgi:hypothetical protein|nr:MAG: hypothetical protein KatS3mg108_1695 [Isosphaeraceae bacterium]
MDQVKEYLQLALKHRFWIAVGIAALLPIIGYFAASGAITAEEEKARAEVKASLDAVRKFESNPTPINARYKQVVEAKQATLEKDVNATWRKLYSRQAPLLTWPEEVADRFMAWGRKWPENTSRNFVEQTIREYMETYNDYVREVYQALKPFDPETGEGIVAAPPPEILLRPAVFSQVQPPTLGDVWAAQERLWIQRTILEVLAKVNERAGAKDWSTAPVKEVLQLEVATELAQDQQSIAEGKGLVPAAPITAPGEAAAEAAAPAAPAAPTSGRTGLRAEIGAMSGMSGGAGAAAAVEPVLYLATDNQEQLSIAPFALSVYVRQEDIPDLLVEFRNSPMDIQILEVSITKPTPFSVQKPRKGESFAGGMMGSGGLSGMMGSGGMMGGRMMGLGMSRMGEMMAGGYGGQMAAQMMGSMGAQYAAAGDPSQMMTNMMRRGGYGGLMGGGAAAAPKRQGQSVRQDTLRKREESVKARQESSKADEGSEEPPSLSDPYYDVMLVQIYGRVSFYKAPPPLPASAPDSPGAEPATPAAHVADGPLAGEPTVGSPADAPVAPGASEAPPPQDTAVETPESPPSQDPAAPTADNLPDTPQTPGAASGEPSEPVPPPPAPNFDPGAGADAPAADDSAPAAVDSSFSVPSP